MPASSKVVHLRSGDLTLTWSEPTDGVLRITSTGAGAFTAHRNLAREHFGTVDVRRLASGSPDGVTMTTEWTTAGLRKSGAWCADRESGGPHSPDIALIFRGQSTPTRLCGFHIRRRGI